MCCRFVIDPLMVILDKYYVCESKSKKMCAASAQWSTEWLTCSYDRHARLYRHKENEKARHEVESSSEWQAILQQLREEVRERARQAAESIYLILSGRLTFNKCITEGEYAWRAV